MQFEATRLVRNHLIRAKELFTTNKELRGGKILLDANENSFGSPSLKWYNRFPDPLQSKLKEKIAFIKKVKASQLHVSNGMDACIDSILRIFCEPMADHVIACPPTGKSYHLAAAINQVALKEVPLTLNFQLDLEGLENSIDAHTRVIFITSPGDPSGRVLDRESIEMVLNNFDGLVVVDESYINYSRSRSFLTQLEEHPNLIVLQNFSHAWGLAGLNVAMSFASEEIINWLERVNAGSLTNVPSQEILISALDRVEEVNQLIRETVEQRNVLINTFSQFDFVETVYPSEANFLLVKMQDALDLKLRLEKEGILVHYCGDQPGCANCLRITVGTATENDLLTEAIRKLKKQENG